MPASVGHPTPLTFMVNDRRHDVSHRELPGPDAADVSATTSLADYLRFTGRQPGTKTMCREGGCGSCVVSVQIPDPATGEMAPPRAVNSCLVPLHACQDWTIRTVEGIGDRRVGYHPAQVRLAQLNGTQCGYCSPGMVMSMYSLLNSKKAVTTADVEQSLDGNLCRCTGYRPILDAFKTFGADADDKIKQLVKDIEDAAGCSNGETNGTNGCSRGGAARCGGCPRAQTALAGQDQWVLPTSLKELLSAIQNVPEDNTLRLVAGNTSQGVLSQLKVGPVADTYISLLKVPELHTVQKTSTELTLGSAVPLSRLVEELQAASSTAGFSHCAAMADHLLRVANTPVRNIGSWAGNLMIKYEKRDFPSDVFLLLSAARATLVVVDEKNRAMEMPVLSLMSIDMKRKVILRMKLPALDENKFIFTSYKVTPRAVNAHAYVNAAFLMPVNRSDASLTVTEQPTLVFGGISGRMTHAVETEKYLNGKSLLAPDTLKGALAALQAEVRPEEDYELAGVEFRASLAPSLLYKAILSVLGDKAPARLRSGAEQITRPLNTGTQEFDTNKEMYPVSKPIPKLEAQAQTSGEAEYVNDQEPQASELFGFFVLSTVGKADLKKVDPTDALAVDGVRGFFTASDVIGSNQLNGGNRGELLFAEDRVHYCGQTLGLVVADSFEIARRAAALVKVEYANVEKPTLTIKEALQESQPEKAEVFINTGEMEDVSATDRRVFEGEVDMGGQYHFTMETQTVRAVPTEDDQITLYSATQDMSDTQLAVGRVIAQPQHRINVAVRRLGGGYGAKLEYPAPVAAAAALAAVKLNRPVRMVLDIETNMEVFGGRLPFLVKYKVAVDEAGKIEGLKLEFICDSGFTQSVTTGDAAAAMAQNCYAARRWNVTASSVTTNLAANTYCRAPGSPQGIAAIEQVMQRIAHELNLDPWQVRKANFFTPETPFVMTGGPEKGGDVFEKILQQLFAEAEVEKRKTEIAAFNQANRWRKRGLSVVPMRYPVYLWAKYPALVSIYERDGTVAISTGGIEMGQGLNTKVAQVAAYELGVSVDNISVKPSNNTVSPNAAPTGGAIGSEMTCKAVMEACQELKARLKPFEDLSPVSVWPPQAVMEACQELKARLKPFEEKGSSWLQVVTAAARAQVNLSAHSQSRRSSTPYIVWGATAAEVELDVLTGEFCVRRVDLYEDAGQSISPWVDVGQAEGAFVMGMGLFLTERHRFHPVTGRRLTNRTWNYYIPTMKDIPRDFRVKFVKNRSNELGVLNSKATGEPPMCMTSACMFALQEAVMEARADAGVTEWLDMASPNTVERAQTACGTTSDMMAIA